MIGASGRQPANRSAATFWVNWLGFALSRAQFPGKYRAALRLGDAVSRACPEAECRTSTGSRFSVQLADRIQRLMWAGCYETELVALLEKMLGRGMVFVDVGANVSYFSALAAPWWDRRGRSTHSSPIPPVSPGSGRTLLLILGLVSCVPPSATSPVSRSFSARTIRRNPVGEPCCPARKSGRGFPCRL